MFVICGSMILILALLVLEWFKRAKTNKIIKEIFFKYSTKANANIVRFSKNIITTRFSHTIYNIDIFFYYKNVRQHYTIKTNNHRVSEYKDKKSIPIHFIPQYFDYRTGIITKEELFKAIGFKFNISNIDIYPMAIFEEDNN